MVLRIISVEMKENKEKMRKWLARIIRLEKSQSKYIVRMKEKEDAEKTTEPNISQKNANTQLILQVK